MTLKQYGILAAGSAAIGFALAVAVFAATLERPTLIGYGCEGVGPGEVVRGWEEDEMPRCDVIRRVGEEQE